MNSNQKCLVAISLILLFVISAITVPITIEEGNLSFLMGATPFLLLAALPALRVWFTLRKKSKRRKRSRYVITAAPPSPSYSQVDIFAGEKLPSLCVTCGQKTKKTTVLKFRSSETNASKYSLSHLNPLLAIYLLSKLIVVAIWAAIYVQLERLWSKIKGNQKSLSFQIPQCGSCSQKYRIHRHHFDFHCRMMTIFARNNLVDVINSNRDSARDNEESL